MPTLGIFAKRPVPGAVKTRLAAAIGADQAARFYEVSLRTLLTRVRGLEISRVIAVAHPEEWPSHPGPLPPSHIHSRGLIARGGEGGRVDASEPLSPNLAWFQQFEGYELWPQPAGGLGEKLAAWFDFACAVDDRVLVIGSDSPTLPLEYITEAITALNHNDCVIGPAYDGGYYLLGLRRSVPELFEGIEWSGPRVVSQTLERAAAQDLRVFQIPTWNDIDEVADLPLLQEQLIGLPDDPVWRPLSTVVQVLVAELSAKTLSFRRATIADTDHVASILTEASRWLEQRGEPMWREGELAPDRLRDEVAQGEYVIALLNGEPVGTLRFQLRDDEFWHDSSVGDAAYVHRLAVRRRVAGGQLSVQLLQWAVNEACWMGRRYLRLDCDHTRTRLRAIYERFGFRYHSDRQVGPYLVARYEFDLTRLNGVLAR